MTNKEKVLSYSEMIILLILVWIICGILCGVIARSKDRDTVGWVILGFLFGIFALVAIAVMPVLEKPQGEKINKSPLPEIIQKMSTADARFMIVLVMSVFIIMVIVNFTVNPPAYP